MAAAGRAPLRPGPGTSLLVDVCASVEDVQAHLGHTDVTTTLGIYARGRPGRSADLATRLDRLIAPGLSTSA